MRMSINGKKADVPARLLAAAMICALAASPAQAQTGERPKEGERFPDFWGRTIEGETVSLAAYRGKYVLVDFWATWCGPCVAELPNLKQIHAQYKDNGFAVLGVSLDSKRESLARFQSNPGTALPWPSIFDGGGWKSPLATAFGINSIPAAFLLGPDGTVIATNVRGEKLRQLAEILFDPEGMGTLMEAWTYAPPQTRPEIAAQLKEKAEGDASAAVRLARGYMLHWDAEPTPEGASLCLEMLASASEEEKSSPLLMDTVALATYCSGDPAKAAAAQRQVVDKLAEDLGAPPERLVAENVIYAGAVVRLGLYHAAAGDLDQARQIGQFVWPHYPADSSIKVGKHFKKLIELTSAPQA